jgi:hypothetical protein
VKVKDLTPLKVTQLSGLFLYRSRKTTDFKVNTSRITSKASASASASFDPASTNYKNLKVLYAH